MGARIALNASPLPVVVTAQKPSDVPSCWGLRFWAVAKACRNHIAQTQAREDQAPPFQPSQNNNRQNDEIVLELQK